jgi:hypothetical protein
MDGHDRRPGAIAIGDTVGRLSTMVPDRLHRSHFAGYLQNRSGQPVKPAGSRTVDRYQRFIIDPVAIGGFVTNGFKYSKSLPRVRKVR